MVTLACVRMCVGLRLVLQLYCAQWLGQNNILCGGTANNLVRIVNRNTLSVSLNAIIPATNRKPLALLPGQLELVSVATSEEHP